MDAYTGNREARVESIIENATLGPPLLSLLQAHRRWEGTARELLAELNAERHSDEKTRKRRDWPVAPRALSNALRRLAPTFRAAGIEVSFAREGKARRRTIVIEKQAPTPSASSASSANPPGASKNAESGRTVGDGDRPPRSTGNRDSDAQSMGADGADDADGENPALSRDVPCEPDHDDVDGWEVEV